MSRYILFNKPDGVVSTFTDAAQRKTLKDYIPFPEIYAAGRLDRDSEGLLLLTDDGELIHQVTDPNSGHTKTYLAQVEGVLSSDAIAHLQNGVRLKDYTTRPVRVEVIGEPVGLPPKVRPVTPHGPTAWLKLELTEGKKHQIRHMTAAVGLPTLRLIRVAIGPIQLGDLPSREWRDMTRWEVARLRSWRADQ